MTNHFYFKLRCNNKTKKQNIQKTGMLRLNNMQPRNSWLTAQVICTLLIQCKLKTHL